MLAFILTIVLLALCLAMFLWGFIAIIVDREKDCVCDDMPLEFMALSLSGLITAVLFCFAFIKSARELVEAVVEITALTVILFALLSWSKLAGVAAAWYIFRKTGYGLNSYRGWSMYPSFAIFGLVLIKYTDARCPGIATYPDRPFQTNHLRVGDVIMYHTASTGDNTAHRIIKIDHGRRICHTKGDYCNYIDPPVRFDQVYAKYVRHINLHYFGMLYFGAYWAYVRVYRKIKYGEPLFCVMPRYYVYHIPNQVFFEKELNFSR
jgi:hypothetical protein